MNPDYERLARMLTCQTCGHSAGSHGEEGPWDETCSAWHCRCLKFIAGEPKDESDGR